MESDAGVGEASRTAATINADGTFAAENVLQGPARFQVTLPNEQFYVKAIRIGARDVSGEATDLAGAGKLENVQVVVAFGAARLKGSVTLPSGPPAKRASVVLFPLGDADVGNRRPVRLAAARADGTFEIAGIAPGRYGVAALNGTVGDGVAAAATAASQRQPVTPITLAAGENHIQPLNIADTAGKARGLH
jgi:hypothetical protein